MILHAGGHGSIAAHVLAPGIETVGCGGHVGDQRAAGPGQRAALGQHQVVLVGISADAGVIILIGRDGNIVAGGFRSLLHAAQLAVYQQAGLILRGGGHQRVADGAVIGLLIVLLAPQVYPRQAVLYVVACQAQIRGVFLHAFDQRVVFFVLAVPGFIGFLRDGGILVVRHHVEEVFADRLAVDAHEQGRFTLADEIPHILVSLLTKVVEHEHLVQGLQRQGIFVVLLGYALGIRPVLGHEVQQQPGVQHLALDLVAVLDQRHAHYMVCAVDVFGQLIEDLVFLRLLPAAFIIQRVVRVNLLQRFLEQGQHALAAAGVADRVEALSVALFDGLLEQLFQRHGLSLCDDFLDGFRRCEAEHAQAHRQYQYQCQNLFHVV